VEPATTRPLDDRGDPFGVLRSRGDRNPFPRHEVSGLSFSM
jgi:hypothetical protein